MKRGRVWLVCLLVFLVCLPPAFFVAITLIGHARPLPYVSVWIDRLVLAAVALGLPTLAALCFYRFLSGRRSGNGANRPSNGTPRQLDNNGVS
jgi:hypothetical protein